MLCLCRSRRFRDELLQTILPLDRHLDSFFMTKLRFFVCLFCLVCFSQAAQAQSTEGWAFSLGAFDIIDSDKATELGIEYRFDTFQLGRLDLNPVLGASGTTEGNAWGYAGVRWDLPLNTERWITTIGFAVSIYEEGDGKDLGGPVEFRSSIDLAYRLSNGSRIGLSFYHLSNARIYDFNPGSESLVLTWSLGR